MNTKFKVGDIVTLKPDSKYKYQQEGHDYGVVDKLYQTSGYPLKISWGKNREGLTDNYPSEDVEYYKKSKQIPVITMKAVKQVTTKIKGVERDLTVVAIINDGQVRVGYAVRNPEDKDNKELSEKIATGRALADRTNLADMTVGIGMDKKYILYAIAEHFVRQIERGSIEVKGIK